MDPDPIFPFKDPDPDPSLKIKLTEKSQHFLLGERQLFWLFKTYFKISYEQVFFTNKLTKIGRIQDPDPV